MDRGTYLSELYGYLRKSKSGSELDSTMNYYEEYFDEAGAEREAEVIAELGPPERLAAQIVGMQTATNAQYRYEQVPTRRKWTTGKVVLLICLFPIWLPLLISLAAGAFSIVVGLGAGGLGCVVGGVFSVWCGIMALFTPGFATTMVFAGMGLVMAGVGLALMVSGIALGKLMFKGVGALCRWLFVGRKRGVAV